MGAKRIACRYRSVPRCSTHSLLPSSSLSFSIDLPSSFDAPRPFFFLATVAFESFFHRPILIGAAALLWPLLRITDTRSMAALQLAPNARWVRDLFAGILFSAIPLLCCGVLFIAFHIYLLRHSFAWIAFGKIVAASLAVPVI